MMTHFRKQATRRRPIQLAAVSLSLIHISSSCIAARALNTVVITGTTRTDGPPRPILGPRVSKYVCQQLEQRGHIVTGVLDPLDLNLPLLEKPHFAYSMSQVPAQLQEMADQIQQADAFVAITPEFNHAPSPGLLNILNHFGSSLFSFKPSAIISYSAGQWGGARAAMALRPILSELGCLPVSAMIHIPSAASVLDEDGNILSKEEEAQWEGYTDRCFQQLEWWGNAAKQYKEQVDPFEKSPAFNKTPSQRNAPTTR